MDTISYKNPWRFSCIIKMARVMVALGENTISQERGGDQLHVDANIFSYRVMYMVW